MREPPHLDPAEHAGIEDVHAGINFVGDKDLWFLHKAMDPPAVRLIHHHTVLRGLFHPCYHNGSLLAVVAVELQQIFERKITDDVRVENEERLTVIIQQVSSQRQGTRCAQTYSFIWFTIIYYGF